MKEKFWKKMWFIVLMCIFIPPVGIALLWVTKKPNNTITRILLTAFLVFYATAWFAGLTSSEKDAESDSVSQAQKESDTSESQNKEEKEEEPEEKDRKEEISIEDGLERISSGEYLFIKNEDLDKYCANMEGVKIYVVTEIDDIKEDMIQSNLSDGYMMSNFHVGENYEKYSAELKEGDLIGISGTVTGNAGYGSMGKSVDLEDCLVFAVGEKAKEYQKDNSDENLSQYFAVTEEVANSETNISEEEYKALCGFLEYEDILRNPESNDGKYCKLEGNVDQIVEGWFGSFTIYVTDYNGNKWGCVYSYKEGESHLLEGDYVVFYGKCKGTDTTETVLGKQVTLPRIDVEYIN